MSFYTIMLLFRDKERRSLIKGPTAFCSVESGCNPDSLVPEDDSMIAFSLQCATLIWHSSFVYLQASGAMVLEAAIHQSRQHVT